MTLKRTLKAVLFAEMVPEEKLNEYLAHINFIFGGVAVVDRLFPMATFSLTFYLLLELSC